MSNQSSTYYNAVILCDKANVNSSDFQAVFEDTTSQNIVNQTGDYKFAIERFSMEGHNLPIWIPNVSSGNTTTYSVLLTYYNIASPKTFTSDEIFLQYIPTNNVGKGDPTYYFVYNYDVFTQMLNNAFMTARSNLQSKMANVTMLTNAPYIVYDGSSNLFSLYLDAQGYVSCTAGEQITITFNNDLYNLLKTFNFTANTNLTNYKDLVPLNKISNYITGIKNPYNLGTNINCWICTQMQPNTGNCWSPIQSLIFASDSISLKPEIVGNVSVVGTGLSVGSGNSNNTQTMITDLVLDLTRSSDYLDMLVYQPTMHRWVDLSDSQNLKNFRFSVWWLNKFNQQRYPILLANNGCITLKVLFQKKI